jgi:hypothetical protein
MSLSLFLTAFLFGGAPTATIQAPPAFVSGLSYEVEIELTAPAGGATVAAWMLTPSDRKSVV